MRWSGPADVDVDPLHPVFDINPWLYMNLNMEPAKARLAGSFLLAAIMAWFTAGCGMHVNQSIRVPDGETRNGSLSSVNGRVEVGNNCRIMGKCRSVNGSITIGADSEVEEIQTVNGGIQVGRRSRVIDDVDTVNGRIRCETGVEVGGSLGSINGAIELEQTKLTGNLTTINGNILLARGSHVKGSIFVKDANGNSNRMHPLTIKLTGGSIVEGDVINQNDRIEVQVIIDQDSQVRGRIENAEVVSTPIAAPDP